MPEHKKSERSHWKKSNSQYKIYISLAFIQELRLKFAQFLPCWGEDGDTYLDMNLGIKL